MRTVSLALLFIALAALPFAAAHGGPARVEVEGLFPGAAVVNVDGARKMLKVGQSYRGVTLLDAETRSATVEIDGERRVLGLSRHIGSSYVVPENRVVTIRRNERMQYRTTAQINGRATLVMVDTGAQIVALSTRQAQGLGIDYRDGEPSMVETANGLASAYSVMLRSVSVGGIQVENVQASVIEGDYPSTVLLGMSYLRHVDMREENGILSLSRVR